MAMDYNQGMNFWTQYIQDSLQSPWFIQPQGEVTEATWTVPTQKIFVLSEGLNDQAYEMLAKMVAALHYSADEVSFIENSEGKLAEIESLSGERKILFFGNQFPGRFGEAVHWAGHQVIQTHDLNSLQQNPALKKQTWAHLKLFATLKGS